MILDNPLALFVSAGTVVLLGGVTVVAFQSRDRPSGPSFTGILLSLTIWALFIFCQELSTRWLWDSLDTAFGLGQVVIAVLVPGIWTIYVLVYTGSARGLTVRRILLLAGLVVPVFGAYLFVLTRPPESTAEAAIASVAGLELTTIGILVVYSTYRLLAHGWNHPRISRVQIGLVWVAVGAPFFAVTVDDTGTGVSSVTVGLLVSGVLLAVAVDRYPVMTTFPESDYVARTRVVEALQEVVFVLDWDDYVIDVNATATELFDRPVPSMIGESVYTVIEELEQTDLSPGATGTVTVRTVDGRRQFRFSVSVVEEADATSNADTKPVARTVLLRDVTDQQTREQRLAVLNRVLRHTVRNKLDVILAHADVIDDDEHRQTIRETAGELSALSQKARTAEEIMTQSTASAEPVDLVAVGSDIVERYRSEFPTSEISLDSPDELVINSHRTVVTQILDELVDNAITHTDESVPQVDVTVRDRSGDAVELLVSDNGPGIPERERKILAQGIETQREHRLGIGLWFVNWAVLRLGGELEFRENDPTGTVVTVRLYDQS